MSEPTQFRRSVRRRIVTEHLNADIAADVNIAISSGGGGAVSRQDTCIHQGRSTPAAPVPSEDKEQS